MLSSDVSNFQQRWGQRIAQDGQARRVIAALWKHREHHIAPVLEFARTQNPIIDLIARAEPLEMAQHVRDHFHALLALPSAAAGGRGRAAGADPLGFVVRHAVRRAQEGAPLRAVLQVYRSGHKSFWSIMCKVIDQLSQAPQAGMRTTMLLPVLSPEVRSAPLDRTLLAFAAAKLNVKACARDLGVHANTVYHRLNRVRQLSGLDPREFAALSTIIAALQTP
jgi:hypothetical protein